MRTFFEKAESHRFLIPEYTTELKFCCFPLLFEVPSINAP